VEEEKGQWGFEIGDWGKRSGSALQCRDKLWIFDFEAVVMQGKRIFFR
jgi:hypothetical protein